MNIGIELRPISIGASGGIALYLQGVLGQLFKLFPDDTVHVFTTIYSRSLLDHAGLHQVHFHTLPTRSFFADMDRLLQRYRIEVLFRSYPVSDDSTFALARQIMLIPDVQHERHPEFFDPGVLRCRQTAFNRWLAQAAAIGTISSHARQEIMDLPATRCRDIFLIPPSLSAQHVPVDQTQLTAQERSALPDEPFFYYPANLWTHKNHKRLFEAFELFRQKTDRPMRLILSGHPAGFDELVRPFSHIPVTHLGYVRPQMVRMLLQKAEALTFFSRYEGFGIPLLEAFSADCPVLCSNTTSLPEVAGDAALLVDPQDTHAMAAAMLRITTDRVLRSRLIEAGRRRLSIWTWQSSATSLHEALHRVAQRANQAENRPAHKAVNDVSTASDGVYKSDSGSSDGSVQPDSAHLRSRFWPWRIYQVYWYEKGFTFARAARELRRRAQSIVLASPRWNRLAWHWPLAGRLLDRLSKVRGVRPDNTLASIVRIVIGPRATAQPLRLCGTAQTAGVLKLFWGKKLFQQVSLQPAQRYCISLALPGTCSGALTLKLSAGVHFRLDETNLFTEQDLY